MAFFRVNLGGETQFLPFLTGDAPPPASAMTTNLLVSYHAPDQATVRRDVDRFLVAADLTTDRLGGRVTMKNMSPFDLCGGGAPEPKNCSMPPCQCRERTRCTNAAGSDTSAAMPMASSFGLVSTSSPYFGSSCLARYARNSKPNWAVACNESETPWRGIRVSFELNRRRSPTLASD